MAWIWGEIDFASLYSYRMPNLSPSYALTSPVPSPAAFRLALVDTAIKTTGKIPYGIEIFELIKSAPLEIEPPEKVAILKFFIKRLKPSKQEKGKPHKPCEESFGIREYCHFIGPLKIYIKPSKKEDEIVNLFYLLRHLGTTDSIAMGRAKIEDKEPPKQFTWKETKELKPEAFNFVRRPVFTLNEIKEDARFSQIDPYNGGTKGNPYVQKTFTVPLIEEQRGENWVIYKKIPFTL
ncbi:MAG: hypothetical protein ACUVXA_09775 [Candidatus Jordarchaeum sp.]|uniref:hypothetical protein n=1 Tax=Candidatus Jordarchaeum sp. TaxID=2823881 RepID=UPI00404A5BB4